MRALFLVPALLAAMLAGCAKPYLDIPEPNKRHKAEAEVALQHAQVGPARNTAADRMTPAVNRVLWRVRASANEVCKELKLPDERCKLMLKARVLVYTEEKDINAFADGEDNVSVLGGLVRNMGTDAEIAGVLAHEFAHVMYGHVEKKTENALIGGLILGSIAAGLAAAAGADGRQMIKESTQLGGDIGRHAYSPEMEIEADRTAIYILRNAGLPLTADAKCPSAHEPGQCGEHERGCRRARRIPGNPSERQPAPRAPDLRGRRRASRRCVEARRPEVEVTSRPTRRALRCKFRPHPSFRPTEGSGEIFPHGALDLAPRGKDISAPVDVTVRNGNMNRGWNRGGGPLPGDGRHTRWQRGPMATGYR